ncbi:MAG: hypothetical protein AAF597_07355, partial [Bacteroidota bacterium]
MKRIVLLLYALSLTFIAFGQSAPLPQKLNGLVTDTDQAPLPSAQLILKNGEDIIGFAMTDAGGEFTLELPAAATAATVLKTRYFGYATYTLPASKWKDGRGLRITLKAANVELKEVVVSADALPQLVKEDTISFRTSAYRDGTEDKIEDVIAKLPGVEVNEAGDISVNGKPLDRILLDGEDVFDRSYKTLSQNVKADYVEQIDVLNNYQSDQLTGDLNGSGELVMDLRLDPARKSIAFGNVQLAGGTEDYRHAETNLFLLRKKAKLINFGRYTTTGIEPSPGSALQQRTMGTMSSIGTANGPILTSPASRQQRIVPVGDYLRNQGYGMAQSLLLTPTSHLRNRLIINVGRDTSLLREDRSRELVTDADVNAFTLNGDYRRDQLNLWLKNDFNLLLDKRTRLDVEATLIRQSTDATVDVVSKDLGQETEDQTSTNLRSTPLTLDLNLRLVRRLNERMALTLTGNLGQEDFDQFQAYEGAVYRDLFRSNALAFGQTIDRRFLEKGLQLNLLHRLGKHRLRYVISHQSTRTTTLASLGAIGENMATPATVLYQLRKTFTEVGWNRKTKLWNLNAMARGNYFQTPRQLGDANEAPLLQNRLAPELSFGAKH